jgi:hypothetical protein
MLSLIKEDTRRGYSALQPGIGSRDRVGASLHPYFRPSPDTTQVFIDMDVERSTAPSMIPAESNPPILASSLPAVPFVDVRRRRVRYEALRELLASLSRPDADVENGNGEYEISGMLRQNVLNGRQIKKSVRMPPRLRRIFNWQMLFGSTWPADLVIIGAVQRAKDSLALCILVGKRARISWYCKHASRSGLRSWYGILLNTRNGPNAAANSRYH